MGAQLPLPAGWAVRRLMSGGDPRRRLDDLARDKLQARSEIREVLDRLAEKHGLAPQEIDRAVQGYLDDMLDDAVFELERELSREIEADEKAA